RVAKEFIMMDILVRFLSHPSHHAPEQSATGGPEFPPAWSRSRQLVVILSCIVILQWQVSAAWSVGAEEQGKDRSQVQRTVAQGGMVVSASPIASEVGKEILQAGGSAV